MKKEEEFLIPEEIRGVCRVLWQAGFENYLVGGCVRDLIIGIKPKDWDITTKATPEQIIELFPKTFYENDFGTVGIVNEDTEDETLRTVEVTPYRIESEYSDFRRPDKIEWGKNIEEDLARRDFTINAIALGIENPNEKPKIIDPFGGQEDIEKKIIRTVGNPETRFGEDALRMLRAVRLSAELGFAIEHETQEAIENHSDLLEHISKERIRDEFIKIIMSDYPAAALEMLNRLNLLEYIAPELLKGIGMEQNQAHAYNVWEHLLRTLEHAAKRKFPLHIRLAALFHDVGKPHTRAWKKNQWTFYGHDVVGARVAKSSLNNLRFPKELVEKVVKLVRWHMFFSDTEEITLSAVRRMVRNVGPDLIWDLMKVRAADRIGTGRPKEDPYRLRKYKSMIEQVLRDPISVKQLAIGGGDIIALTGREAGPYIGLILDVLLSEVLDDPKLNTKDYLSKKAAELATLPDEELKKLGKEAREKNAGEEERELKKIKGKYSVK